MSTTNSRSLAFWSKLDELKNELSDWKRASEVLKINGHKHDNKISLVSVKAIPKKELLLKIENLIEEFFTNISNGVLPKFSMSKRGGVKNTDYVKGAGIRMKDDGKTSEISLSNSKSLKRYAIMMSCLSECYKLIASNKHSTKRDIYYSNVNLFGNQRVVDECYADISCMLRVPRNSLNVLSASKGLLYGFLTFKNSNDVIINCADQVTQVPSLVERIGTLVCSAKYVLVVEKEATFQRLVEDRIHEKLGPSLLVTAKGFPDINTRMLLHRITEELPVPVFMLCDGDPYGIEIMCVYKYGSKSLSYEAHHLSCPSMRWIGFHPKDVEVIRVSKKVVIPLSTHDRKKASDLLKRPYILQNSEYRKQVEILLDRGTKAEIECLDSISQTYLTDIYLPLKMRNGDWM